jgi:hypothetical protein
MFFSMFYSFEVFPSILIAHASSPVTLLCSLKCRIYVPLNGIGYSLIPQATYPILKSYPMPDQIPHRGSQRACDAIPISPKHNTVSSHGSCDF